MIDLYEVDEDSGNPDPDENTYTERTLQACGHWQVWEQFKGLPMNHDPKDLCWECEVKRRAADGDFTDPFADEAPCPACGEEWPACCCPCPTVEEERARMGEAEAAADRAWERER